MTLKKKYIKASSLLICCMENMEIVALVVDSKPRVLVCLCDCGNCKASVADLFVLDFST